LRTFYECFPITLRSVREINVDAEIHVRAVYWDKTYGRSSKINDSLHSVSPREEFDEPDENRVSKFVESLGVKSVKVKLICNSLSNELAEEGSKMNLYFGNILSQYYIVEESWKFAEDVEADCYVRLRPDVILNRFPNMKEITSDMITNQFVWYNLRATDHHENEMFWVARNNVASSAFSLYSKIVTNQRRYDSGKNHGEAVSGSHFKEVTNKIHRFDFDYRVRR
jgi:hypothetical protein